MARIPYEGDIKRRIEEGSLIPNCTNCEHFRGHWRMRCAAFPSGIPQEIQSGQASHLKPYPGDGGIQYTPRTD